MMRAVRLVVVKEEEKEEVWTLLDAGVLKLVLTQAICIRYPLA
jgi:hypothetical protein